MNNKVSKFLADGIRSIRFGKYEMNSMGTKKFYFYQEERKHDSVNNVISMMQMAEGPASVT